METQNQILVLGNIRYDLTEVAPRTGALVSDLATIQAELDRLKLSYDIANIAKKTVLDAIQKDIDEGISGLQKIEEEPETAEATETTETTETE